MGTKEEYEMLVKLAITQMDLKYTGELAQMNTKLAAIPGNIAEAIRGCQIRQESKRRWSISTIVSMLSLCVSAAVAYKVIF